METTNTGAHYRSAITYYRLKYPDAEERLDAVRADFLAAFELASKRGGKTLTSAGADGVNQGWVVTGITLDTHKDVLAQVVDYYEKLAVGVRQSGWGQGRIA